MRSSRVVASGVLLLASSACLGDFSLDPDRAGFINARAFDDGGNSVLRVDGAFYRGFGLDVLVGFPGLCQVLEYSSTGGGGIQTLDAGPSFAASIAGNSAPVSRVTVGTTLTYEMSVGTSLPYTPGDTLTVSIDGQSGGFPAATVRVRTAEPFVMEPVVAPPTGPTPTVATWTPATVPGSVMTLSLRYSTLDGILTPNAQIYCVFHDTGSGTIPENLLDAWIGSDPASRSQAAQRVREASITVSRSTKVRLFSFYDVPTPTIGGS